MTMNGGGRRRLLIMRWTVLVATCGLVAMSSHGVPFDLLGATKVWDVYSLEGNKVSVFAFDALWYLAFFGAASVLSLAVSSSSSSSRTNPLYGHRRFWICVASALSVAQLVGSGWLIMGRVPTGAGEKISAWFEQAGLALGFLGVWTTALSLLPLSRASPLFTGAFGVPFDACQKAHAVFGRVTTALLVLHVLGYVVSWRLDGGDWAHVGSQLTAWPDEGVSNLAGVFSLSFLLVALFALSLGVVRRRRYAFFYRCHVLGLLGYVLFGSMHWDETPLYLGAALTTWIVDLARRLVDASVPVAVVVTTVHPNNLVRLDLSVPCFSLVSAALFTADPSLGLFVSVQVPSISWLQWHPFSCYPRRGGYVCWVRSLGPWTSQLASARSPLRARLGTVAVAGWPVRTTNRPTLVVAGGTGIVPLLGYLRRAAESVDGPVTCLWSIRYAEDLDILASLAEDDLQSSSGTADVAVVVHYTGTQSIADVEEGFRQRLLLLLDDRRHSSSKACFLPPSAAAAAPADATQRPVVFGRVFLAALYVAAFGGAIFGRYVTGDGQKESWKHGVVLLVNMTAFAALPTLNLAAFAAVWMACTRDAMIRSSGDNAVSMDSVTTPVHDGVRIDIDTTRNAPWTSLQFVQGRPDITAHVLSCKGGGLRVYAAGPPGLVDAASRACSTCIGIFPKPNVDFEAVSYDIADL